MNRTRKSKSFFVQDNCLQSYLDEIADYEPLLATDEQEAARRIKKGDRRAYEKLVKANLRFVVSVARNYENQGVAICDLINEGNMGLMRAAERFDETKNFKFISYAVWWIRQAILQALANQSRTARLPLNRVADIYNIEKTRGKLEQQHGRKPDNSEVAEVLSIPEQQMERMLNVARSSVSFDRPMGRDDTLRLHDVLQDEDVESPDQTAEDLSLQNSVKKVLLKLSAREREVVSRYFGIGRDLPATLDDIGKELSITRERVRQIKDNALRTLRESGVAKNLSRELM